MKINKTRVCKSNARARILFVIISSTALVYLIPGSARAEIRGIKHQRVPLIIETFDHQNIFDDSSSDIYISNNDESSSEGESTSKDEEKGKSSSKDEKNDEEEDDDDWEA